MEAATDPNAADDYGEPWLHRAVFRGDTHAVDILLERGADPNRVSGRGATALHVAVMRGKAEVASAMLDRGADPLVRDDAGWSPLDHAVVRNDRGLAELLVDRGAEVRTADKQGVTPLHRTGSRSVAKLLLDHGADPNARDESGRTPVELELVTRVLFERCLEDLKRAEPGCGGRADRSRRLREIQNLVDLGLAPVRSGKRGDTLLHRAARQGDNRLLTRLLTHGANPEARNADGEVALHVVEPKRIFAWLLVRKLLRHGADPDARNSKGDTPLHVALKSRLSGSRVILLLRHGADPDTRNNKGDTPLHVALKSRLSGSRVILLLRHGADPDTRNNKGDTPLHVALKSRFSGSRVILLLRHGAEPNARNNKGHTPLHVASKSSFFDSHVIVLLRHGADPNALNNEGETPLHHGADSLYVDLMVNRDNDFYSRLFQSCHEKVVRFLLRHGADPHVANRNGFTPLHVYCVKDRETAILLLNHTLDVSVPAARTALDRVLETYGDPRPPEELRDDTSLVRLEERLLRGDIPEGAARVVVTVRLAEATQCRRGVRKWLKAHVPNADPCDKDFGLPVAEVMRLANRRGVEVDNLLRAYNGVTEEFLAGGYSAEAARVCASAIRLACVVAYSRRVAGYTGATQAHGETPEAS